MPTVQPPSPAKSSGVRVQGDRLLGARGPRGRAQRGSALITVLWCVIILSTVVFSTLNLTRAEIRIARGYGDRVRAHYTALAGIEYAKAVIYTDLEASRNGGGSFNDGLFDDPDRFREVECGPGHFSILRSPLSDEASDDGFIYGVLDEERFLSVNHASKKSIATLPELDEEIGASIVDWRDGNDQAQDGGAEAEYYSELSPSYQIANQPISTMRELLMIRGVTAESLFGEDHNADGLVNASERDGDASFPEDNEDDVLDLGWARYITLESRVANVDPTGEPRLSVGDALEEDFAALPGVGDELAASIVLWREQESLEGVLGLLKVREMTERPGQNGESAWEATGDPLIDQETLFQFADYLTDSNEPDRAGVVNVNTCSREVLACLPGMDEEKARAVIDHRAAFGYFDSTAGLLEVDGLDENAVKAVMPRLDVRSDTFRICAEGVIPETGARQRVLVTVRFGEFEVETLSYREDL